jgi:hypothetical protein
MYQKLYQELEPNGVIVRFLRDENVGNLLWTKDLRAIHDFVDNLNHAQFEFLDPDIEKCRTNFMKSLSKFSDELKANTWLSRHDENLSSMEAPDYDPNHPKWKKVDEINKLGTQTFLLYEDLIRILKKNLGLPIKDIKLDQKLSVTNNFPHATIGSVAGEVNGNLISDQHNH